MKHNLRISLRPGERIYVNGAVLRADRKVSLEFLNEVSFLLESHVILEEDTTTPLRQLYFVLQTLLMEPQEAQAAREVFEESQALLLSSFSNPQILAGLHDAAELVAADRIFESLKTIRTLFPIEAAILGEGGAAKTARVEVA